MVGSDFITRGVNIVSYPFIPDHDVKGACREYATATDAGYDSHFTFGSVVDHFDDVGSVSDDEFNRAAVVILAIMGFQERYKLTNEDKVRFWW